MDLRTISQDPDFMKLPIEEQKKAFIEADPDFASLPKEEQIKGVSELMRKSSLAVSEREAGAITELPEAKPLTAPEKETVQWALPWNWLPKEQRPMEERPETISTGQTAGGYGVSPAIPFSKVIGGQQEALSPETMMEGAQWAMMGMIGMPAPGVPKEIPIRPGAPLVTPRVRPPSEPPVRLGDIFKGGPQLTTGEIVREQMPKATRFAFKGKGTPAMTEKYFDDSEQVVRNIIENKNSLKLMTPQGESVVGKLPETPAEFDYAISQGLQRTWEKSSALPRDAQGRGVMIKPKTLARELINFSKEPTIQDLHPALAKEAEEAAARITARIKEGGYTPLQTEREISALNHELDALYGTPGFKDHTAAGLKAMQANNLRKDLDKAVSSLPKEYQGLKNEYGAFRNIQDDVHKKALLESRKVEKGFFDLSNIFTTYHILHGAATGSVPTVASGIGARLVAARYKYLNSPNRAVTKMFKDAERTMESEKIGRVSEAYGKSVKGPIEMPVGGPPRLLEGPSSNPNLPAVFEPPPSAGLPVATGEGFGMEAVKQPRLEWWRGPGAKGVTGLTPAPELGVPALPEGTGFTMKEPGWTPTKTFTPSARTYPPGELGPGMATETVERRAPLPFLSRGEIPAVETTRGMIGRGGVTEPPPSAPGVRGAQTSFDFNTEVNMAKEAISKGVPPEKVEELFRQRTQGKSLPKFVSREVPAPAAPKATVAPPAGKPTTLSKLSTEEVEGLHTLGYKDTDINKMGVDSAKAAFWNEIENEAAGPVGYAAKGTAEPGGKAFYRKETPSNVDVLSGVREGPGYGRSGWSEWRKKVEGEFNKLSASQQEAKITELKNKLKEIDSAIVMAPKATSTEMDFLESQALGVPYGLMSSPGSKPKALIKLEKARDSVASELKLIDKKAMEARVEMHQRKSEMLRKMAEEEAKKPSFRKDAKWWLSKLGI